MDYWNRNANGDTAAVGSNYEGGDDSGFSDGFWHKG